MARRIGDSGIKLGGARKDLHVPVQSDPHAPKSSQRKKDLWPEPDFRADATSGRCTPEHAAIFMAIYRNLPSIPYGSHRVRQVNADADYKECLLELRRLYETGNVASRKDVVEVYNAWAASRFSRHAAGEYAIGRVVGRSVRHPLSLGFGLQFVADGLPQWGWPWDLRVSNKDSWGFIKLSSGVWRVCEGVGRHGQFVDGVEHMSEFEASAACSAYVSAIIKARDVAGPEKGNGGGSKPPRRPSAKDVARVGPEWRDGPVSELDLQAKFGFRAIEFGNWCNGRERQALVNSTWDALMDLTEVIGLPARFASLGGRLAIAFGSRGRGFGGGAAHYEPDKRVLHFTKTSGAGAVAHEFGHALDHFLGVGMGLDRFDGKPYISHYLNRLAEVGEGLLAPRLSRPARLLHGAMFGDERISAFLQGALALDGSRKEPYWATRHECFARAFEAWASDTLKSKGRCSPYLVHGAEEDDNALWSSKGSAYPGGHERRQIFGHMDNFLWEAVDHWTSRRR